MQKVNFYIVLAIITTLFASSCTTVDPYTRENKVSKTGLGTGIGAAGGALIGAIIGSNSGNSGKYAAIGAGIGALAGGSAGLYMDKQETELRNVLNKSGVSVTRDGDNITLNMPGNITFATAQSNIEANFYDTLNSIAIILKKYRKTAIKIIGHTDNIGSGQSNQILSENRAKSVLEYLGAQGINKVRMKAVGMGEYSPIASNKTKAGRQQNRRVQLILVPIKM